MDLIKFEKLVHLLQEQQQRTDIAYDLKIDLIEFCDPLQRMVDILIKEIYGQDGYEWFSWFCYDSEFGKKDWSKFQSFTSDAKGKLVPSKKRSYEKYGAFDANGKPICFSVKSTWEFLEKNYSRINKGGQKKSLGMEEILNQINGKK